MSAFRSGFLGCFGVAAAVIFVLIAISLLSAVCVAVLSDPEAMAPARAAGLL